MGNIYFRKEAEEWNQAFPVGNGFLGAMVFGNVAKERIQVNEDSVWSGGFSNRVNPDAGRYLEKIRECLFEGNVQEAEKLAEQSMYATSPNMRVYQPLGDIWIRFMDQEAERKLARDESGLPYLKESAAEVEAYQRILNLEQAVGKIEYCVGKTKWNREFFASNPAKVAMYSICAESGEDINLEISATRKDNRSGRGVSFCDRILAEENQYIWLEGSSGGREGIGFAMGVRVCSCGGRQYQMGSRIIVEKARKVLVCFTGRTTFRSAEPKQWCRELPVLGGAIIGFGGVKQYSAGTNGIFGWLQVINPQTGFDSTVVAAIIACIASFVSAVVLMKIFDKKLGIDHI